MTEPIQENSRLRIVVLSAAHVHAETYLSLLSGRHDVDVALSDPDGVSTESEGLRGRDLADHHGVPHLAADEVYAWNPAAVVICAENAHHRRLAEEAAAAGAHILCEKPLATSYEDAAAMIAAAENAGVALMTAYPMRFSSEFAELLTYVRDGTLGEILSIRGTNNGKIPEARGWFTDRSLAGGGALTDHVVHCADLIDELVGSMPVSVHAVANSVFARPGGRGDVETAGLVTLVYPTGVIATIDCSWSRPQESDRWGDLTLTVEGTHGAMTIAPFAAGLSGDTRRGASWVGLGADLDARMLGEFIASIRADRAPRPDGHAGARTVGIVEAAYRSVAEGRAVQLT